MPLDVAMRICVAFSDSVTSGFPWSICTMVPIRISDARSARPAARTSATRSGPRESGLDAVGPSVELGGAEREYPAVRR